MYLFTTNADNNTHNMNQIQQINEKICMIQAEHDRPSSKNRSTEGARKLSANLYVSKKSKVMLLWNINLPYSVIIQFNDYKGPPFFSSIGCKQYKNISDDPLIVNWVLISPPDIKDKWVPILASEFKWGVKALMMILIIVENNFPYA
jgi:hypothetical protein